MTYVNNISIFEFGIANELSNLYTNFDVESTTKLNDIIVIDRELLALNRELQILLL